MRCRGGLGRLALSFAIAASPALAQGGDAPPLSPTANAQEEATEPGIGLPTAAETRGRTRPSSAPSETAAAETPAVDLSILYTFDIWRNARGGLRRGWRYLDNLDVTLTIDTERAIGWPDATLFVYGLYNNGRSFSEELAGDVQGVANIETGVRALRLYEAWVEQRFGRASIKLGLYDLNSEFDEHRAGSLFLNSTHGLGPDFSQSGLNGPSVFPVTSLALRVDYQIDERWRVRAAILDAVPGDPARPRRTAIRLRDAEGALLIGEGQYEARNTRAILGYWRYTAGFASLDPTAPPSAQRGNDGLYMMVEQRLSRIGADGARGLAGWLRLGLASDRFNPIDQNLSGGLVYMGPIAARPADQVGIAFSRARFGAPHRAAMALAATPVTRSEISIEASYFATLTPWLSIRPDVQYVINPGGNPNLRDALILGLRTQIGF
jgi:porin